jgi:isoquinoline 1-oxidoreductase subunit beta
MTHPAEPFLSALSGPTIDRRGFLTIAAKGLALAFVLPAAGRIGTVAAAPTAQELATAYVRIGTDGSITLAFGGAEMGQGSMSGLAQILAEELMVDWGQFTVQQSLLDPIVSYFTGGSSAVRGRYATLRNVGAAARELLIAAAMAVAGDNDRDNFSAASATVTHVPSGTVWRYGDLAAGAATQTVPADLRLTDPANFRLIGKPVPRIDLPAKTDGSAVYGIDVWFPDMVFAAIKHCPTIGGTLATLPAKPSAALAVVACTASDTRGKVVAGTTNAVAVVASNTWLAFKLANSLSVKWTLPASTADVDSAQILATAKGLLASGAALVADPTPPAGSTPGSYAPVIEPVVAAALGTPTVDATYTVPYVAHATMEVLNCTVRIAWSGATPVACEIWAPTQAAGTVAANASKLTGLPTSAIKVNTTFLGGGLGRKIEQDYIWQAIQVAMAVKKPVKLTWKREEDFGHDQYRPFAITRVRASLDAGRIKAWWYRTVSQAITGQRGRLAAGAVDSQAVEGAVHLAYDLGTDVVEWVPLFLAGGGVPVGYWRSVGASINAFVVESVMDELAKAAGNVDPFVFRANHMVNAPPRAVNLLQRADLMTASWRKSLPAGRAWGMAIGMAFNTWVCEVVEISQPAAGTIKVHRVDCFVDCGTVINTDSVEAQMQGSILHGLNAALWGQTTFTAGKANQLNFNRNRVMRISEMPRVTVDILPSTELPTGVGEPGVPPLAPALANAYARLTGTRVRSLPFFPGATMGGI